MINTGSAFFEQRCDDDYMILFRKFLEGFGGRARDWFGKLKIRVVFGLAEILGTEKFLGADNLRALFRGALSCGEGFLQIGGRVGRAGGLNQTDGNFVI